MKITIKYLLRGESEWQELHLAPEEYFDLSPDDKLEEMEVEGVDIYYLNPWEYTGYSTGQLVFLEVRVVSETEEYQRRLTFWNNGDNFLEEYKKKDFIEGTEYMSICISSSQTLSPDMPSSGILVSKVPSSDIRSSEILSSGVLSSDIPSPEDISKLNFYKWNILWLKKNDDNFWVAVDDCVGYDFIEGYAAYIQNFETNGFDRNNVSGIRQLKP